MTDEGVDGHFSEGKMMPQRLQKYVVIKCTEEVQKQKGQGGKERHG